MEIKKISAADARKMSENVEGTLKRIYKFITEAAHENATSLLFNLDNPSPAAVNAIKRDLAEQGYVIEELENDEEATYLTFNIKW